MSLKIAIHPFDPTADEECIREIRSHYVDNRYTQWKELVSFSKLMFAVLRHDHDYKSDFHSKKIACVDKDKWMQSVIWPIADFTRWLARLLYFTKHLRT